MVGETGPQTEELTMNWLLRAHQSRRRIYTSTPTVYPV
jgi:hypothetical protein